MRIWMGLVITVVFAVTSATAAPYRTTPIWPPQPTQQLSMYRVEVVVTHKVSKQTTTLSYHESFADAAAAANALPVVRGVFFEWLKANYDMNEAEFNEEFDLELRVVTMPGGATLRRAA